MDTTVCAATNNSFDLTSELDSAYESTLTYILEQEKAKNNAEELHVPIIKALKSFYFSKYLIAPFSLFVFSLFQIINLPLADKLPSDSYFSYSMIAFLVLNVATGFSLFMQERLDYTKLGTKKRSKFKGRLIQDHDLPLKIVAESSSQGFNLKLLDNDKIIKDIDFGKEEEMKAHETLVSWQASLEDFRQRLQEDVEQKAFEQKQLDDEVWKAQQLLQQTAEKNSASKNLVEIKSTKREAKAVRIPKSIDVFLTACFLAFCVPTLASFGIMIAMSINVSALNANHKASQTIAQTLHSYKQTKGVFPTASQLTELLKEKKNLNNVGPRPNTPHDEDKRFLDVKGSPGNYDIKMAQGSGITHLKIKGDKVIESFDAIIKQPDRVYTLSSK